MTDNAAKTEIEELRSTVAEILDGDMDFADSDKGWLQKWWAVRVRALLTELDAMGLEPPKSGSEV